MNGISPGDVVIVNCREPKEKMWGLLLRLDVVGLVLRGVMLDSVDDWLRQEASGEAPVIGPSTVFLPMHRVQRVDLDESTGPVPSFQQRYEQLCARPVAEALAPDDGACES